MPNLTIQMITTAGRMIENGKWVIPFPAGFQENQTIAINLPIQDPALIGYLGRAQTLNCAVDKEDDSFTVAVSCSVMRIRHMVNIANKAVETMAMIAPRDRLCEHVLLYLLSPSKCEPKFIRLVRGENS